MLYDFLMKKDAMCPGFYAPNFDKKMLMYETYKAAEQESVDGFVYRHWKKNRRLENIKGVGLCACVDFVYEKIDRKARNECDRPKNNC